MSNNRLLFQNKDGQLCAPKFCLIKDRITDNGGRSLESIVSDFEEYCIKTGIPDRRLSKSTLINWLNDKSDPGKRRSDVKSQVEVFIEFLNDVYSLGVCLEDILVPINSDEAKASETVCEENGETHNYHYRLYYWVCFVTGSYGLLWLIGVMCFLVPIEMTNVPSKYYFIGAIPASAIAIFSLMKIRRIPPECIPEVKRDKELPSAKECYKWWLRFGIFCVTGIIAIMMLSPRWLVNGVDFFDVYVIPLFFSLIMFTFFMLYLFSRDNSVFPENSPQ